MALFGGIQEYIVFDLGNIFNISGNIFLYPPQGHPILYNYFSTNGYPPHPTLVIWSIIFNAHAYKFSSKFKQKFKSNHTDKCFGIVNVARIKGTTNSR